MPVLQRLVDRRVTRAAYGTVSWSHNISAMPQRDPVVFRPVRVIVRPMRGGGHATVARMARSSIQTLDPVPPLAQIRCRSCLGPSPYGLFAVAHGLPWLFHGGCRCCQVLPNLTSSPPSLHSDMASSTYTCSLAGRYVQVDTRMLPAFQHVAMRTAAWCPLPSRTGPWHYTLIVTAMQPGYAKLAVSPIGPFVIGPRLFPRVDLCAICWLLRTENWTPPSHRYQ